ncbi:MAG: NAD-dependent epimerase/dehydratase family protein [Bryobacteraceae bacterium]
MTGSGSGSGPILITGALGWLGKRLTRLLAEGQYNFLLGGRPEIRCLLLPGQDASELRSLVPTGHAPHVEVVAGDLRYPQDCARFLANSAGALLLHTAGIIHPRRVREFYEVNVQGAINLLAAARKAHVRRAVMVSSNSPLGCNPHPDHLFDESSPYHPYMNYGRSKMRMEQAAMAASPAGGLETVIVRPPWFYGPDQPPRQTLFFRMVKGGKAPLVGRGENLRSMVYVDNLIQGLLLAATHAAAAGQIYWIADRRPYAMREIIDTIERLLEEEFSIPVAHRRLRMPGFASTVAEAADAVIQAAGLYHQKIHVLSEMNKTIACSIQKAERELGYRPQVALEEGMRRSIRWCLERGIAI